MPFVDQAFALFGSKSGERKHSDLVGNVIPVSFASVSKQGGLQSASHFKNSSVDLFQFSEPFSFILRVSQDSSDKEGSVEGRRTVHSSDHQFDLTHHFFGDISIGGDEMQASDSFSVESEILGITLGEHILNSGSFEDSERLNVSFNISGGISLIGTIEVRVQLLFLENLSKLSPLIRGGVNSGGVVGTGMQKHNAAGFSIGKSLAHSFEVESFGLGVEVRVFHKF